MIADALDKVGSNGVLSIESSSSTETFVEVTEGMEIDRGYISPQVRGRARGGVGAVVAAGEWAHLGVGRGACLAPRAGAGGRSAV